MKGKSKSCCTVICLHSSPATAKELVNAQARAKRVLDTDFVLI